MVLRNPGLLTTKPELANMSTEATMFLSYIVAITRPFPYVILGSILFLLLTGIKFWEEERRKQNNKDYYYYYAQKKKMKKGSQKKKQKLYNTYRGEGRKKNCVQKTKNQKVIPNCCTWHNAWCILL